MINAFILKKLMDRLDNAKDELIEAGIICSGIDELESTNKEIKENIGDLSCAIRMLSKCKTFIDEATNDNS